MPCALSYLQNPPVTNIWFCKQRVNFLHLTVENFNLTPIDDVDEDMATMLNE